MALFRISLDGNILSDEPEGWADFISELKRDKTIRGQVLLMDLVLKFKGNTDGYAHLKPLIDCQGFCAFSTVKIEEDCNSDENWITIFDGIIFYTNVKEFLFPCVLECTLTDNSFFAKIDNNKNIEAYVNVGRSKNDVEIITQSYIAKFFDVNTGIYSNFVNIYPVWYCFEFMIKYMTDGEMNVVSDYFKGNLLGETQGQFMTITTGNQIRLGVGNATIFPFISFQKIFEEVNKKVPISFSIETDATGKKTMRIEPKSYFFNTGTSTTLNNVKGIVKSVDTSQLYAKLNIGSSKTLEYVAGQTDFPQGIIFLNFKETHLTLTGKCNVDTTLDLVSDWVTDSNVIQDIFSNGNTGYEEDIIFVMADYMTTQQAIQTDIFNTGAPPYFYNDFLRNVNVAQRWLGGIPNSVVIYQGSEDDEFMATSTADVAAFIGTIEPFAFQDDFTAPNFDPNNRYNNISYRYTAPSTGVYSFETVMLLDILGVTFCNPADPNFVYFVDFTLVKYDSAGNEIQTIVDFRRINSLGLHTITSTYSVYLAATDYVVIRLFTSASNICSPYTMFWKAGSTFACTATVTGGGQFASYSPEDFKAYQYQFNYPITFAQYQSIIANPLKLLAFNDGTNDYSGWIENMKYKHREGTASFVLTTQLPKTTCE